MGRIKNDLEAAVQKELARHLSASRGRSPGGAALRSSVTALVSRISQSGFLASRLPVDRLQKATSGLLGEKRRSFCDCPVCRTDVLALALTSLPPCYCRSEHYGIASARVTAGQLAKQLESAIHRVTLRPRHAGRAPILAADAVELVNFRLAIGERVVAPILAKIPGACRCELCQFDTLAFALNQMPSKYGVSVQGKLRMPASGAEFLRHELAGALAAAAKRVAANPRHGGAGEF